MPRLWEDNRLPTHAKARAFLENFAKRRIPITYQELAKALQISPPQSIHQVTEALERLMEEDAAADRPLIAALAISKARGGLPAPGFFDCPRPHPFALSISAPHPVAARLVVGPDDVLDVGVGNERYDTVVPSGNGVGSEIDGGHSKSSPGPRFRLRARGPSPLSRCGPFVLTGRLFGH